MKCDRESDQMIKDLIYKNKIVIFGTSECEYSKKANNFFKQRFNNNSIQINIDEKENNLLKECLIKRTRSVVVPMIYINGMYMGNYSDIQNMEYRKDLEIFF